MIPSLYHKLSPTIQPFSPKEKGIVPKLTLQVEPWAFDTLHEYFPETDEYDYRLIQKKLKECIFQLQAMLSSNIHSGTEIMIDFINSILVFEVKSFSQSFYQNEIEESYILDLSKIELKD